MLTNDTPQGAVDVARLLEVKTQTVYTWRHRHVIPEPDWIVSGRPVWRYDTIKEWAIRTGRWPDP